MNGEPSPGSVISELPQWQGATWTALPGGLTNTTWKLQKGDRKAVLKIDARPRQAPYNTRLAEAAVQTAAAQAGLATQVLHAECQVYITDFVEGTVWDPASLDDENNIEQLGIAVRRLHSLPLSGRSFDSSAAAQRYVRSIRIPDEKLISRCLRIIDSTPLPRTDCFCHNDLVAENIIATPGIKFLDWEYACDNDPLFDLATIIEHHELNEARSHRLLDAYFDGAVDPRIQGLAQQRRLYLALLYLWLASRPDSAARDLRQVAKRMTTNCS